MDNHPDFSIRTRWFNIELAICQFRESYSPTAYRGIHSVDLFVPFPGNRTLWIATSSRWLAKRLGGDPSGTKVLASVVPEPPHKCKSEGCEFETENYGTFLTRNEREHAPESNADASQEKQ
jgi:hypothetical protein